MEFCFRLTVWECMVCGVKRASGRLFHIPSEVVEIYRRCGKAPRTVRIEDGSIFVAEETVVREYLCRNILEFKKRGKIYWIVMTGRLGNTVQLFLPVRVVGDGAAQDAFWRYLNDQRRLSGDHLVAGTVSPQRCPAGASHRGEEAPDAYRDEVPDACRDQALYAFWDEAPYARRDAASDDHGTDQRQIRQKWNLDKLSGAVAECLWIQYHCMKKRWWKDWGVRRLPYFLACAVVFLALWKLLHMQTIPICLALLAMLAFRTSQELEQQDHISMKGIRSQVKSWGRKIYEEEWNLSLDSDKIERKALYLENVWRWELIGYLIGTESFYFFFDRQQTLLFYVENGLFGDWMAQKLFVQECQARGIRYQTVQPQLVMDLDPPKTDLGEKILPIADVAANIAAKKQSLGTKQNPEKNKKRHRETGTQEGWRKFWAEKEKEQGRSDKKQVVFVALGIAAALLLAFLLPEYGGRQDLAGMPVLMDMPSGEEPYVFHPESYKDYTPLEKQVEVLESLGFEIPQEAVAELTEGMEAAPIARVYTEGYPYRSLLSMLGMPKRNYDTWEMESYPDQAYWFDWEGFDISQEYVFILNGVNAMAKGEVSITDISQEMSDADWEKGSGTIHISFCVNGTPYDYQLRLEHDWLDTRIIADINDALKRSGIEKRVYAAEDGGQGCVLFYRDKEWAKRFREATGIRLETK